jgi:hypothetical protein
MKTCYYCGAKANNKEHLPPKQFFKRFRVDCLTVYSCEKHNIAKSFDDETIVKSMLFALEKDSVVKNDDIKLALEVIKPHHSQVKNKVSENTLYKEKNTDYNFIVLKPDVDLSDWIRKLSAGLIWYKTRFFDPENQFDNSFIFERNSYPYNETPKDLSFFEQEYKKKIELTDIIENGNWINGWNDKKNIYPVTIYAFYYKFIGKMIIIKHIFYQQFTFYNFIILSEKTLLKLKANINKISV